MQAVILAAGKGTRLRPLTYHTPKPLLVLNHKRIIDYIFEALPPDVDEVILVVSYLASQIKSHLGEEKLGKRIKYVTQKETLGTADAVFACRHILKDRFLVLMGDDLYKKQDIERCLSHKQCMLVDEIKGEFNGGKIELDKRGNLKDIVEGTHKKGKHLINTGLFVLPLELFNYEPALLEGRGEYGLPQTVVKMSQDLPVTIERATFWFQINNHKDLEEARKI